MQRWIKSILFDLTSTAVGTLVALAFWTRKNPNLDGLVTTIATVAGALLGFLLTALAIIIALPNKRLLRNMAKTGHAASLYSELFGSGLVLLLVTACSLCYFLFEDSWSKRLAALVGAYFALSMFAIACSAIKLYKVLEVASATAPAGGLDV